jgi:tetratricopeptide (TPR) repeat protein
VFQKLKSIWKKSSGTRKPVQPAEAVASVAPPEVPHGSDEATSLPPQSQSGGTEEDIVEEIEEMEEDEPSPASQRKAESKALEHESLVKESSISREDIQAAMQANNDAVGIKKTGDVDKSLSGYQRAISLYSQYAIAYYNRAILYSQRGEWEKALLDYNKAIEINPRDPEFYNNRGNLYTRQQNFEKALADYNQAIHLSPNNSEMYHNRAQLYVKLNQMDMALEDFKRAIELNPDLVSSYFNLACLYAIKGNIEAAFELLEKAFRKGYKNVEQVKSDPDMARLRENPAFEDLMDIWGNQSA